MFLSFFESRRARREGAALARKIPVLALRIFGDGNSWIIVALARAEAFRESADRETDPRGSSRSLLEEGVYLENDIRFETRRASAALAFVRAYVREVCRLKFREFRLGSSDEASR